MKKKNWSARVNLKYSRYNGIYKFTRTQRQTSRNRNKRRNKKNDRIKNDKCKKLLLILPLCWPQEPFCFQITVFISYLFYLVSSSWMIPLHHSNFRMNQPFPLNKTRKNSWIINNNEQAHFQWAFNSSSNQHSNSNRLIIISIKHRFLCWFNW